MSRGGKWGLLLRRPLEAMTRTLWLVGADADADPLLHEASVPVGGVSDRTRRRCRRYANGLMTQEQALTANAKHAMLNPVAAIVQTVHHLRGSAGRSWLPAEQVVACSAMPIRQRGTQASFDRWRIKFENLSRHRHPDLRHPADGRRDRLDQVAGRDLVLVDLGSAVPGGPGIRGAGAGHSDA